MADSFGNSVRVFFAGEDAGFSRAMTFAVGEEPWSLLARDWTADGVSGLLTRNTDSCDFYFRPHR